MTRPKLHAVSDELYRWVHPQAELEGGTLCQPKEELGSGGDVYRTCPTRVKRACDACAGELPRPHGPQAHRTYDVVLFVPAGFDGSGGRTAHVMHDFRCRG